jgi:hypothetical protein
MSFYVGLCHSMSFYVVLHHPTRTTKHHCSPCLPGSTAWFPAISFFFCSPALAGDVTNYAHLWHKKRVGPKMRKHINMTSSSRENSVSHWNLGMSHFWDKTNDCSVYETVQTSEGQSISSAKNAENNLIWVYELTFSNRLLSIPFISQVAISPNFPPARALVGSCSRAHAPASHIWRSPSDSPTSPGRSQ